jgi:hypothetical protein
MDYKLLKTLRVANCEFAAFMAEAATDAEKPWGARGAPRRLGQVNERLRQVAACVGAGAAPLPGAPEVAHEMARYGETLRRLRSTLATLHTSCLVEKARLDHARANVYARNAWAASLRAIS